MNGKLGGSVSNHWLIVWRPVGKQALLTVLEVTCSLRIENLQVNKKDFKTCWLHKEKTSKGFTQIILTHQAELVGCWWVPQSDHTAATETMFPVTLSQTVRGEK